MISKQNDFKKPCSEVEGTKEGVLSNSSSPNFFLKDNVKQSKTRLSSREVVLSLLRAKNWKQTNLADKIGLSRQALNNYLSGRWDVPTTTKIKIAEALEVDSAVIWDLEIRKC